MKKKIRLLLEHKYYLVMTLSGSINKSVYIITRIHRVSEISPYSFMEILINFLLRVNRHGSYLSIMLVRDENTINCYLVLQKDIVSIGSIDRIVNTITSYLETLSSLAKIEFEPLLEQDIKNILKLLTSKVLVFSPKQKVKIQQLSLDYIVRLLRPDNLETTIRDSFKIYSNAEAYNEFFWRIMTNNTIILLKINLAKLKALIASNIENKPLMNMNKSRKELLNEKIIRQLYKTEKFTLELYSGIILNTDSFVELTSSKNRLYKLYLRTVHLFLLNVNKYIDESIKPTKLRIESLLSILSKEHANFTIKAQYNIIVILLATALLFMMLTRFINIRLPELSICEEATKGDIHIGWQLKSGQRLLPFYINFQDLKRHILILGRTGSGKTRLARIIVEELLKNNVTNVWIFDFHKEYIDLATRYDFKIFEPGTETFPLYLNIFDSKYEDPESYSTFLTTLLLETMRLKSDEISPQMERALSYSIWATVTSENPSPLNFLRNLAKWCEETSSDIPTALYTFYAITNRLKPFFSGISKHVFWVEESNIDITELLNKNVIFDLSYLFKRNLKREILLLVNIILRCTIMTLFNTENLLDDDNPPRLTVLVEEGRYLIPWRKIESTIDTTAIEDFATLARKYGLGLMVISQSPQVISNDIISNAGTLFLMNSEIPEKEYIIIDNEHLRRYVQIMPPRQALVKLSRTPALVHIEVKKHKLMSPSLTLPLKSESIRSFIIKKDFEEYIKELLTNYISK